MEDMADAGLPAPEYIEGPNTVRLILRNNIDERMPHRNKASDNPSDEGLNGGIDDALMTAVPQEILDVLDDLEKQILRLLVNSERALKRSELESKTGKSNRTISNRLNHLQEVGIVKANGNRYSPGRTYELVQHQEDQ